MENRNGAKRAFAFALVGVALAAAAAACVWCGPDLFAFFADGARVQAWIDGQGVFAPLAMAALIAFQIVVAILPGEPLELAAGYAFGFWEGTALCLVAGVVGTAVAVWLARVLGMRFIGLFFSPEKLASVKWLQDSARFELLMFVCFLIPGTPKDLLTYGAGLTRCPVHRIVFITTVGRIPSIVSSTLAAEFAASGNWAAMAAVVALTVVLAAAGMAAYAFVVRRERARVCNASHTTTPSAAPDATGEDEGAMRLAA